MVKRTLQILQQTLQDFECVFDHFVDTRLRISLQGCNYFRIKERDTLVSNFHYLIDIFS